MNDAPQLNEIVSDMKQLQDRICAGLEALDGKARFREDNWVREGGGGGRSRVMENGNVFEKGGVNFSHVHGTLSTDAARSLGLAAATDFSATGVSLVIHPLSPMVPVSHMNVRYFETGDNQWWFGGGMDVTPVYVNELQAKQFHQQLKDLCDAHQPAYYDRFSKWAHEYFWLRHRNESRGIGGLFFDRLTAPAEGTKQQLFDFVKATGDLFVEAYCQFVNANRNLPFGESETQFKLFRRSRYVEFNLLWDRGTSFGLQTGGRTESILMSMPPLAKWEYDYRPEPGSKEEKTMQILQNTDPRWI
jgi:coproporphyrinogen III oxidase